MANKLVLIPQDLWRGMVSSDTGDPNLDFTRHELEKVKRERANASTKNLHYNQQLRRYLKLRNERENRPTRVELGKGLRMIMKSGDGSGSDDEIAVEEAPQKMPPRSRQKRKRITERSRSRPNSIGLWGNDLPTAVGLSISNEYGINMDQGVPGDDDIFEDARTSPPPSEATSAPVPPAFIPAQTPREEPIRRGKKRKGSEREFAPKKWRLTEANTSDGSNRQPLRARFLQNRRRQHARQNPTTSSSSIGGGEDDDDDEFGPNIPLPPLDLVPIQQRAVQRRSELKMMPTSGMKTIRKWAPYSPINAQQRKAAAAIRWANQKPTAALQAPIQPQPLPSSKVQEALQAPFAPLALPASSERTQLKIMPTSGMKAIRKWAPYPPSQAQRKEAEIRWAKQRPTAALQASIQPEPLPSSSIQEALQAPFAPLALPAPPRRRQKRFDPDLTRVVTKGIKKRKPAKLDEEIIPVKKSKPSPLALTAGPSTHRGIKRHQAEENEDKRLVKRSKPTPLALAAGPSRQQQQQQLVIPGPRTVAKRKFEGENFGVKKAKKK